MLLSGEAYNGKRFEKYYESIFIKYEHHYIHIVKFEGLGLKGVISHLHI